MCLVPLDGTAQSFIKFRLCAPAKFLIRPAGVPACLPASPCDSCSDNHTENKLYLVYRV